MVHAAVASSPAAVIAAVISAVGALLAAAMGAWAILKSRSYDELLEDIKHILKEQLAADTRGPVIARWVRDALREVIREEFERLERQGRWRR